MSRLLINENPLQILPSLARLIGVNEAIVLQQIHYWLGISKHFYDGRKWVYNSVSSWHEQFNFWSEVTVKRTLLSLKEKGLIFCENYNSDPRDRTKWYSINYEKLEALDLDKKTVDSSCGQIDTMNQSSPCGQIDQIPQKKGGSEQNHSINLTQNGLGQDEPMCGVRMTQPLPETTTETTTETTKPKKTGRSANAEDHAREKNPSFEPSKLKPKNVSEEIWKDWIKFRREVRKPLTQTTCQYQARQLENHQNPDEVICMSITNGWQGLFPDRVADKPVRKERDYSHLSEEKRRQVELYEFMYGTGE